ncbi:putative mitochondrial seryl-trna synthetase [Diaporthe ampelina]|uniref:Putative mitochondrial seryl-trna synthetase n=1 Tax=Diaporthe ampelina TaxID=1214573 RepID=A0A0G2FSN5_9PEZI|nr:putative mitochondrial seryl-trna synthetase [Diaporthe ampelina]
MWKTRLFHALLPLRQAGTRFSQSARRLNSTKPPQSSSSSVSTGAAAAAAARSKQQSRADRILSRLPRGMQGYAGRLRSAPLSHVVAFLVLHELTAVVPLLGLFGLFHYGGASAAPIGYMMEHYGGYVRDGTARFERYFTRKGWFGFGQDDGVEAARGVKGDDGDAAVMSRWQGSDEKYRIVVEVALAYAITKALLPARIVVSLWATPWFAGLMGRMRRFLPLGKGRQ